MASDNEYNITYQSDASSRLLPLLKTSAREQPVAEVKFTDTRISRGVTVTEGSTPKVAGTTVINAWQLGRVECWGGQHPVEELNGLVGGIQSLYSTGKKLYTAAVRWMKGNLVGLQFKG